MSWDPHQYLKFKSERLRPGFDLLAQVGELPPGPIVELGCGTGPHARAMALRWPERTIVAIDKSPQMLAEAAAEPSTVRWLKADIVGWSAPEPAALVYSTATLQWLEGHDRLFPHLLDQLAPSGVLAVQMPRNFDAPSHALMRETAAAGPWAERLRPQAASGTGQGSLLRIDPVGPPAFYYDLLRPRVQEIEIWETEYLHVLEGADPVLEWVRGSALRPVIEALPGAMAQEFEAAYAAKLRAAYPRRADGRTLLPFRRLFIVARR
ncbi:MAG TPA: methyltransferase domain-containing protein [Stellaceae bacterium]|nr:methyltransferase domain-containing protein [Stellaceae bacterium]